MKFKSGLIITISLFQFANKSQHDQLIVIRHGGTRQRDNLINLHRSHYRTETERKQKRKNV